MTHPVAGAGGELPPQDDSIRETLTKIETMICFFIAHSLYEYRCLKFHTAGMSLCAPGPATALRIAVRAHGTGCTGKLGSRHWRRRFGRSITVARHAEATNGECQFL